MPTLLYANIALNDAAKELIANANVIETDERYGPRDLSLRILRHELPDGRVFTEFHQDGNYLRATIYLALKDAAGNVVPETIWTRAEMGLER